MYVSCLLSPTLDRSGRAVNSTLRSLSLGRSETGNRMTTSELLRRQWEGYPRYHQSRFNLQLHLVLVPVFLASNVALVVALIQGSWLAAIVAAIAMVLSIAFQGRGHGREPVPPELFTSPINAVARIFLEQWVTFPRFVLSGNWLRALRRGSAS